MPTQDLARTVEIFLLELLSTSKAGPTRIRNSSGETAAQPLSDHVLLGHLGLRLRYVTMPRRLLRLSRDDPRNTAKLLELRATVPRLSLRIYHGHRAEPRFSCTDTLALYGLVCRDPILGGGVHLILDDMPKLTQGLYKSFSKNFPPRMLPPTSQCVFTFNQNRSVL